MEIATITSNLVPLAFLACPVGMGAMMWMMARGNRTKQREEVGPNAERASNPASLEVLREEHQRLGAAIEELEQRPRADEPQPR